MNIVLTVALAPALFTEPAPADRPVAVASGATLDTQPVAASLVREHRRAATLDAGHSSSTTSTTAAPTTTTPPTTAAPRPAPKPQPTVRAASAPTTTTTAAPKPKPAPTTSTTAPKPKPRPTTTTTAPAASSTSSERTESGEASWYDHQPGICAHKTLPMGTVVTVTSTANGKSTTCKVGDRGPFIEGWIIDLHPEQFEQLAPRSAGVIAVRISW